MAILSKVIYRYSAISIKILACFLAEIDKLIIKFMWKCKEHRVVKTTENNKVGRLVLPDRKSYYTAAVIKTVWFWHKDTHVDQWNRTECPEINPHIYSQQIFHRGAKTIQSGKRIVFSTNSARTTGVLLTKE